MNSKSDLTFLNGRSEYEKEVNKIGKEESDKQKPKERKK